MQPILTTCPGCGSRLTAKDLPATDRYNASAECFQLFTELSGFTLSENRSEFIHQLAVDAYGAQHAGGTSKSITTIFALIGLCLVTERGFTGRQVQQVHMKIPKQQWPTLQPPKQNAPITVENVLHAADEKQRTLLINEWVRSVWSIWKNEHDHIRKLVQQFA